MEKIIISTDYSIFLLTVKGSRQVLDNFITNADGLGEAIKANVTRREDGAPATIKSIKMFDVKKQKFVRTSKAILNQFTNYNTATNLILKSLKLI